MKSLLKRLSSSEARVSSLVRMADQAPQDAELQTRVLSQLNDAHDYRRVKARVESNHFALNKEGTVQYIRAMAALGKLDQVPLTTLAERISRHEQTKHEQLLPKELKLVLPTSIPPLQVVLADHQKAMEVKVLPNRSSQLIFILFGIGAVILLYRSRGGQTSEVLSMLKGTHQLASGTKVRFNDVIGLQEAKDEVRVLVDYLKDPAKYNSFGIKMPKGLIMFGPPGVGKTLLAKAMAGEAGVPFFYISASQIEEVFVGLGAARIRNLFADARKSAPSVIFIDEIDAIGSKRNFTVGSGGSSLRQSLNQMLTLMDGFDDDAGVLVIAATNADEDSLDSALLRSGRFDKKVYLHAPFKDDRKKLFQYYLGKIPSGSSKDVEKLSDAMAALTWGCSGADVANICNQAAILTVQKGAANVGLTELQTAHADVLMGPANKSLKSTEEEKKQTAYHEAGHCIVALHTPKASLPRQVTIVPRRTALGYMTKSLEDHVSQSREGYLAEIATAMGGRAAEEVIFGDKAITSGAESDFAAATRIARAMVANFGFSDLGPIHVDVLEKNVSEATREKIDAAISEILHERYEHAVKILKEKAVEHRRLAKALLDYETLAQDEILKVVKGQKLDRT